MKPTLESLRQRAQHHSLQLSENILRDLNIIQFQLWLKIKQSPDICADIVFDYTGLVKTLCTHHMIIKMLESLDYQVPVFLSLSCFFNQCLQQVPLVMEKLKIAFQNKMPKAIEILSDRSKRTGIQRIIVDQIDIASKQFEEFALSKQIDDYKSFTDLAQKIFFEIFKTHPQFIGLESIF